MRSKAKERQRKGTMATPGRALTPQNEDERVRRPLAMLLTTERHSMEAGPAVRLRKQFKKAEKNYRAISWPLDLRKLFRWAGL